MKNRHLTIQSNLRKEIKEKEKESTFLKRIANSKVNYYSLELAPKAMLSYLEIHKDSRRSLSSWSPSGKTLSIATARRSSIVWPLRLKCAHVALEMSSFHIIYILGPFNTLHRKHTHSYT